MKQLKKTLLTLVALLAVTTGAWADETPLVTINSTGYTTFTSGSKTFDDKVTVTFSNSVSNDGDHWGWYTDGTASLLTVAGINGYTITSCKFYTFDGTAKTGYTVAGESPSVYLNNDYVYTDDSKSENLGKFGISKIEVYGGAAPATYTVSMKEGTDDAANWQGKAGEGEYQALPLEGVAANTAVSVKYSGTKKVKSVKAVKKAPAGPPSWKLTLSSPAKDLYITANGGLIAQHTLDVASTEFTVEMPELTSQTVNIVATDGSGNCWYCTQENMSFAIGQTYQSSPTMTALDEDNTKDAYKITGTVSTQNIPDGKTVVLSDVTISSGQIACSGDATIILMGDNTVTGASINKAAIKIGGSGTTLTITGSGSLTATGGNNGAGIGTDNNGSGGNIVINGGTVNATGGSNGAGIGTGRANNATNTCDDITINGGRVTATGGYNGGAGIGTGVSMLTSGTDSNTCGAITIGTGVISVTANKSSGNSGPNSIGKGRSASGTQTCGTITIGGTIYWDGSAYQNDGETYLGSDITYPTAP